MLRTFYSSEAVENMFAPPKKVCALCDANFSVKRMVKVESINRKPVESPTYVVLSDKALNKIMEAVKRE